MDTDVPLPERDETIESLSYSDGFGRMIQRRSQAEDLLFGDPNFGGSALSPDQSIASADAVGRRRAAGDPLNVVVSGTQVYDNKGRVVEKFEPYFSTGMGYAVVEDAQLGQKAVLSYDPRGRLLRTLNPDGSEQRVVYGIPADLTNPEQFAPSPWESYTYDANDLAPLSKAPDGSTLGAAAPSSHHFTPVSYVVDPLGRTTEITARSGPDPANWFRTRTTHDIRGNVLTVTDALGRVAFRHAYDLANRPWRTESIDAGLRRIVLNVVGNQTEGHDSKGGLALHAYDRLQRPNRIWARDDAGGPVTLRQRMEYGDGGSPDQPATARAAMRGRNLLGQLIRHHDDAGLAVVEAVDFKGNLVEVSRRVIADAPILAVFEQGQASGWQVTPFQVDWEPKPQETIAERENELLERLVYQTTTTVDALSRVKVMTFPQDVEGKRRELRPSYNSAGELESVYLDDALYVERIAYDAKGHRSLIAYGNGVMVRYAYDPHTFRLSRLRAEHFTRPDAVSYSPTGEAVQDFGYDYDLVGNVLAIRDRTPGCGILNNPEAVTAGDPVLAQQLVSGNALNRRFEYDPIYRLLSTTGRECDRPPEGEPWQDQPRSTDLTKARAYAERYAYDPLGNMVRLDHLNQSGGFHRDFTLESASNRLRRMQIGETGYDYTFDACGNQLSEGTSRHFEWNHSDQLKAFRTQTDGAEPSVHVHYLYDAAGQRVKKLVRKQGGPVEVTHYIAGAFEHHRWSGPALAGENNQVHVMDDQQRIAMARLGSAHPEDRGPAVQFHLGDHLGSSNAVLDDSGVLNNREEFTPYGETSFGSFARKRYRFTRKERDEETGLTYHGARYLAPWLGRWVSADPAGMIDGVSLYVYVGANPITLIDPTGTDSRSMTIPEMQRHLAEINAEIAKTEAYIARLQEAEARAQAALAQVLAERNEVVRQYHEARYQLERAQVCAKRPDSCAAPPDPPMAAKVLAGMFLGAVSVPKYYIKTEPSRAGMWQARNGVEYFAARDNYLAARGTVAASRFYEDVTKVAGAAMELSGALVGLGAAGAGGGGGPSRNFKLPDPELPTGGKTVGTAKVNFWKKTSGNVHMSVETQAPGGRSLHTHQLQAGPKADPAAATKVFEFDAQSAAELGPPTSSMEYQLNNVKAAQAHQESQLNWEGESGRWSREYNSCITTTCDVLRSGEAVPPPGGEPVPAKSAAAYQWAKRVFNF
jgi:RHS repeat-associated protein